MAATLYRLILRHGVPAMLDAMIQICNRQVTRLWEKDRPIEALEWERWAGILEEARQRAVNQGFLMIER
jgi:hypothetical protein